jgi:benzoate membrane transport protein
MDLGICLRRARAVALGPKWFIPGRGLAPPLEAVPFPSTRKALPLVPESDESGAVAPACPGILGDVSISAVCAGFIAVAVSYAGPMLVIIQAAERGGLDSAQTASWVWAVSVGSGIVGLVLSLFTRHRVVVAWSVPGSALLLTVLGDYEFSEAIGAYIVAGVLLPFVLNVTQAVIASPLVSGGLVVAYFAGRRLFSEYAVPAALVVGVVLSMVAGQAQDPELSLALTMPVFTVPAFSIQAIMGISVPFLIVTMAGQNGPGLVMMRTSGYSPNDRLLLSGTCVASVLFAPFGSHAINLAAITAGARRMRIRPGDTLQGLPVVCSSLSSGCSATRSLTCLPPSRAS